MPFDPSKSRRIPAATPSAIARLGALPALRRTYVGRKT